MADSTGKKENEKLIFLLSNINIIQYGSHFGNVMTENIPRWMEKERNMQRISKIM